MKPLAANSVSWLVPDVFSRGQATIIGRLRRALATLNSSGIRV